MVVVLKDSLFAATKLAALPFLPVSLPTVLLSVKSAEPTLSARVPLGWSKDQ